jgi:hypothetical protein
VRALQPLTLILGPALALTASIAPGAVASAGDPVGRTGFVQSREGAVAAPA